MRVARGALPIDPHIMIARADVASLVVLLTACSRAPDDAREPIRADRGADPAPNGRAAKGAPSAPTFSREAFAPPPEDAGAAEPPVPTVADSAALDEILAAAPSARPATEKAHAIGSDTGVALDAGAADDRARDRVATSKISVGKVTLDADMSNPAIERAARAQLYWPLVQRCRDPGGAILPPEAVHLRFQLDADGYVLPPTILATPKGERFADASRCMQRELSMATFRAPAAARGRAHTVETDVPSVD